jgi:hypothetical protein
MKVQTSIFLVIKSHVPSLRDNEPFRTLICGDHSVGSRVDVVVRFLGCRLKFVSYVTLNNPQDQSRSLLFSSAPAVVKERFYLF